LKSYEIPYDATTVSTNVAQRMHWRYYHKMKVKVRNSFAWLIIEKKIPPSDKEFSVYLDHNGNFDVDNYGTMAKWFIDELRQRKIVPNDHKKYQVEVRLRYNKNLPKDSVLFTVNLDCNSI
jgi:hypothetical protein